MLRILILIKRIIFNFKIIRFISFRDIYQRIFQISLKSATDFKYLSIHN